VASGEAEAIFALVPDSRLPRWFSIPAGFTRKNVWVSEDDYRTSSGRTAVFKPQDYRGHTIDQVAAIIRADHADKTNTCCLFDEKSSYPAYEIMTARGVTEVFEYRAFGPLVRVNDDPNVRAKLGQAQ
jgi:hypothetical protein